MATIWVKPSAPDLVVLIPAETPFSEPRRLSPDGEEVQRSSYWLRSLRRGDVIEIPARPTE